VVEDNWRWLIAAGQTKIVLFGKKDVETVHSDDEPPLDTMLIFGIRSNQQSSAKVPWKNYIVPLKLTRDYRSQDHQSIQEKRTTRVPCH